jgi:hypothetical protein
VEGDLVRRGSGCRSKGMRCSMGMDLSGRGEAGSRGGEKQRNAVQHGHGPEWAWRGRIAGGEKQTAETYPERFHPVATPSL